MLDELEFFYNDKVYNPEFTQHDVIVVADAFIRKSRPDLKILDLGTGCGIIGLTLKHLHPDIDLTCTDISAEALKIAKKNAKELNLKVKFKKHDMIPDEKFDMIVTNLPSYTEEQMKGKQHSPESTVKDPNMELYKKLFDSRATKIIVHEIQKERQDELHLIATGRGWEEIMKTDFAYGWLRSI